MKKTRISWSKDENHIFYDQVGAEGQSILEVIFREKFKRESRLNKIHALKQVLITVLKREEQLFMSSSPEEIPIPLTEKIKTTKDYQKLSEQDQKDLDEFLLLITSPNGLEKAVAWLKKGKPWNIR